MDTLRELYDVVADRKANPRAESYTNALLDHPEKVFRKLNEETYELIYACLKQEKEEIAYEAGDLLYHLLVLLVKHDISWDCLLAELEKRRK